MKKILGFLLVFQCVSCARFIYYYQDIKPISAQDAVSIRQFMHRKNIDSINVYLLRPEFLFSSLKNSVNRAFLFDSNGISIQYDVDKENKKCLGNIWSYVLNYKREQSLLLDSSHTFENEYNRWQTLSGQYPESLPEGGDLTIVYYWNTFSGNANHRNFFKDIEKIMRDRPDLEIVFYKINQDLREDISIEKFNSTLFNQKDSIMKTEGR